MPTLLREQPDRLLLRRTSETWRKIVCLAIGLPCLLAGWAFLLYPFWVPVSRLTLERVGGDVIATQETVRFWGLSKTGRQQFRGVTKTEYVAVDRPVDEERSVRLHFVTRDGKSTPLELPAEWEHLWGYIGGQYQRTLQAFLAAPNESRSVFEQKENAAWAFFVGPIFLALAYVFWFIFFRKWELTVDAGNGLVTYEVGRLFTDKVLRFPLADVQKAEGGTGHGSMDGHGYQFRFVRLLAADGGKIEMVLDPTVTLDKLQAALEWINRAAARARASRNP